MEIDFVVAWVDGDDPKHQAKITPFKEVSATDASVRGESVSKLRFESADEVRFCLRSLRNHAPWVRKIWLVTDDQFPASVARGLAQQDGIEVVDHKRLFAGHEHVLPTFNSISISTMLYKIPGLAEHFVYFNDDVFLTAPALPTAFFREEKIVLRGDYKALAVANKGLWHNNQLNSATMMGLSRDRFFFSAHVAKSLKKSIVEELAAKFPAEFAQNITYRFRSPEQFLASSLHDHHALATGRAVLKERRDWQHFGLAFCETGDLAEVNKMLYWLRNNEFQMSCINNYPALVARLPEQANEALNAATGAPRLFEKHLWE